MKNKFKLFGIISLVTVIVFTIVACNKDGGDKEIPVKVRAFDNSQTQQLQSMAFNAKTVQIMDIMPLASGFSEYEEFYTWMESNKGTPAQITPTKFVLNANIVFVTRDGYFERPSLNHFDIDFSQPGGYTIDIGDIPTDITCSAIAFNIEPYGGAIEFAWPGGKDGFESNMFYGNFGTCTDDGIATLKIGNIDPYAARAAAGIKPPFEPPSGITHPLRTIAYGVGTGRRYSNDDIPTWELVGLNSVPGHGEFLYSFGSYVFIPFTAVNIPSSASSITINISWNLDSIISHYDHDTSDDYSDDIFVLKNGWWNGLQINITVQ